jgi:MFS family permease
VAQFRPSLRHVWTHARQHALRFTAGGRWSEQLHPSARHNLRWFWSDGVFAMASDAIVLVYLPLFVLALGGTRTQIGLMNALSNLSAALLLLPGALVVERWGRRKQMVLLGGGGVSRAALLLLALIPLAFAGPVAVYAAIALVVIRNAFANLSMPAWTSLTADIVPLRWRGRYFSSRNTAMGIAQMLTTLLAGQLITYVGDPEGYQLVMGLAFAIGLAATWSFARIQETPGPGVPRARERASRVPLLQHLRGHPDFVMLCATAALWNFSLNIAGPFFSVYLVETLKASAGIVGTLSVISSLAALPGQRLFGPLSDRWGPRRVQLITGLLIPLIPPAWAVIRAPWQAAPLNLASGFLWAGYNLASFNLLLTIIPAEQQARYSAFHQIVVMAALAGGAALGGVVAENWGYKVVFALSGAGRLIAALLFARLVRTNVPSPIAAPSDPPVEA